MKNFMLNVLRSIFNAISIYLFVSSVMLIINSDLSYLGATLLRVTAVIILMVIFRWLATRTGTFDDLAGCEKEFKDVASCSKANIVSLGIVSLVFFIAYVLTSYYSTIDLDVKYPDATETLKKINNLSDSEWGLYKALPVYVKEIYHAEGQAVHDILEFKESDEFESEEAVLETVDIMSTDLADNWYMCCRRAKWSIVFLLILSFFYTLSSRCSQYLDIKKKLKASTGGK